MRMAINKFKWFAVSVSALSLLMVFWVWPAWNSGSQRWYLGNDNDSGAPGSIPTNTMFRNQPPLPPHNADFVFPMSFSSSFMANEAAMTMLNFGTDPWQVHIEWYPTPTVMMGAPPGDTMGSLGYELEIGRWSMSMSMMSMFMPFFTEKGLSMGTASMENPIQIAVTTMMSSTPFSFEKGDVLALMLSLTNMMTDTDVHVFLKNTSYITSPLSDPGYPGAVAQIPTLSQWGMLLFAVILAVLSVSVIRRRVRVSRH